MSPADFLRPTIKGEPGQPSLPCSMLVGPPSPVNCPSPLVFSVVSSARQTPPLWWGMSVLQAITAQPPRPLLLSSPAPEAPTGHREGVSSSQTALSVIQAPTASCLGWWPYLGLAGQGSTAFKQQLSPTPLMESQETSVLQATFVPKAAPDPLHALQALSCPSLGPHLRRTASHAQVAGSAPGLA